MSNILLPIDWSCLDCFTVSPFCLTNHNRNWMVQAFWNSLFGLGITAVAWFVCVSAGSLPGLAFLQIKLMVWTDAPFGSEIPLHGSWAEQQASDCKQASGHIFLKAERPSRTRVGRFLPRTKLDELPKVLGNICREMKQVGTHPLRMATQATTTQTWFECKTRRTGEWQIMVARAEISFAFGSGVSSTSGLMYLRYQSWRPFGLSK